MSATKWIIIAILATTAISVGGVFVYDYKITKSALETKKAELIVVSEQIKTQNEAIEKLKIDVETYKNQKPQVIEKIVTKYQNIEVIKNNATCEEKLSKLEEYVKVFYNRHSGSNYIKKEIAPKSNETQISDTETAIDIIKIQKREKAQEFVDKMLNNRK